MGTMHNQRYTMGPNGAERFLTVDNHLFGKVWDEEDVTSTTQLKLSIADDKSVIWLSDRAGRDVQMDRGEALKMMAILNREFLLDILGQV